MRTIFKDEQLDREFADQGFLKFQFLDESEIQECRKIFDSNDPKLEANFYSSIDSKDFAYRRNVHDQLKKILDEKAVKLFKDYKAMAYTFIAKKANSNDSTVHCHADDTHIYEENNLTSVNFFCPLVDTNRDNGALYVLPGSHKLHYPWRGFSIPFPYESLVHTFLDKMIMAPQKAGEVILYSDRLIHRSETNRSDGIRPVIVSGFRPVESTQVICYMHDEQKHEVEIFKIDQDFWFTFDPLKKPIQSDSLGIHSFDPIRITTEEFETNMGWN